MKYLFLVIYCFILSTISAQTPITGRTTGRLPYMDYGLGTDRLGGAKMNYLDTGILVKVIDSTGDVYKVQLSTQHAAYLPKTNFKVDTAAKPKPSYLTGSWRVNGDSAYDYVTIGLPERLPYRTQQQIDPSRIVIDIFGATSNTNWVTQLKTVKEVKNVWHEQLEDDVFRIYIELKHAQHWGYFVYYKNNILTVRVKRQPEKLKVKHLNIAIDAGHGGSNAGASGTNTKIQEKDYTLLIAKQVEKYLKKKGANLYMTRNEDVDLGMIDRTLMLREQDPNVMVSIHLNSSSNATVSGTSTYYRYIGFRPLTQHILDRMLALGLNNFGNVGSFNFALSGPTEYPNCLVEVAFLSNAEDEKRINDPKFHKQVAKQIYKGIKDWLKSLD
ncbi:N-acetylmuramoyl-L-alanine amidase [Flavisolibacter tropicus]|uniref:N-acetylmuramoyl-L-alanine amidase n=1 Tax=Flavisolibacter tropicus TaxID=1492898 RepID=A0A172TXB1_9BACT|nr:N-acetylmuramoyl-L-alanine amidase [Flavisolibacter tropicus]ANE51608.1 hypothetical protein SY85_14970 [Flavisolibacter tropicus]